MRQIGAALRRARDWPWLPWGLFGLGGIGAALLHHLPAQLGLPLPAAAYPASLGFWAPWLALAGAAWLWQRRQAGPAGGWEQRELGGRRRELVSLGLLALIIGLGGWLRLRVLLDAPERAAAVYLDYDESVYAGAASLLRQGHWLYRDVFLPHPPGGPALIAGMLRLLGLERLSLEGLVRLRQLVVGLELLSMLGAYLTARQLGGRAAGLLAALAYASGGLLVTLGRQVMLEPLQAPLLLFAAAAYVRGLADAKPRRWLLAAGGLAGAACAIKLVGAVLPLAMLLHLALLRRWADWRWTALGAAAAGALILAPFLLHAPLELPRQVIGAQLGRSQYGLTPFRRAQELFSRPDQAFLAVASVLGALALALRARAAPLHPAWGMILLWTAGLWAFIGGAPSFYEHYYASLALGPVCLAGACALAFAPGGARLAGWRRWAALAPLLALPLALSSEIPTYRQVVRDDFLAEAALRLAAEARPEQAILAFEPTPALLAGHNPIQMADGQFFLDTFLWWSTVTPAEQHAQLAGMLDRAEFVLLDEGRLADADPSARELLRRRLEREFWSRPFIAHPSLPPLLYYRVAPPRSLAEFAGGPELLSAEPPRWRQDGPGLEWTVYWRAAQAPAGGELLFVHIVGPGDAKLAQIDVAPAAELAGRPGLVTPQRLRVPLAAPPPDGEYRVLAGLFNPADGTRRPASSAGNRLPGDAALLAVIRCAGGICQAAP